MSDTTPGGSTDDTGARDPRDPDAATARGEGDDAGAEGEDERAREELAPEVAEPPAEPVPASQHVNASSAIRNDADESSSSEPGSGPTRSEPAVQAEPAGQGSPAVPAGSAAPAEPELPAEPDLPAESGRSTELDQPVGSGLPAEPETSVPSAGSELPAEPGTSAEPESLAEPGLPAEPGAVAEPGQAAEPGTSAEPDQPGEPASQPVVAAGLVSSAAQGLDQGPVPPAALGPVSASQEPTPYGNLVSPIYIATPLPPKKKSNRGYGSLIALVGTVVFAVVYALVIAGIGVLQYSTADFGDDYRSYLASAAFYIPVIFFAVAMVLLVQIINRAGWWAYIIGGFFVAVVVYFAFVGGALVQHAGGLTPDAVTRFVGTLWVNPFGIAGGIVAREVAVWTGLWLSARGRKLKALNAEARADYERGLAVRPQSAPVSPFPNGTVPPAA